MINLTSAWDHMINHAAKLKADPLLTCLKASGLRPPNQLIYSEGTGCVVAHWTMRLGENQVDSVYVTLKCQDKCWRVMTVLEAPGHVQGAERFLDLSALFLTLDAWQESFNHEVRLH
jgi:hypothetical protein